MRIPCFFLLVLLFPPAFAHHPPHPHHHGGKPDPVEGVTSLDVYADGATLHLLLGEQSGESTSLLHRRSSDGGRTWSEPVRLPGPSPRPVRRGDDAQVAARGETVLALWSVPGEGWGGSGPFASALSLDGGKTWTPAGNPSDSGLQTGHGFADLLADASGFHAVWLDSRDKSQGLRHASSVDARVWSVNQTIVPRTCECCWNTLLARNGVLNVLYRAGHPRDMALAVLEQGAWRPKGAPARFDWHVKGCPETGGGLAATPDGALHALVWTGKDGALGVHVASERGGAWSAPRRLGSSDAQHGDLAANANRLAAAWDEAGGIFASLSSDGTSWTAPRPLASKAHALNPRVVPAGAGFLVLWTEAAQDGRRVLRSALLQ